MSMPLHKQIDLILARKQELWNDRSSWDGDYKEVASFLKPRAGRFSTDEVNKGGRKNRQILDNWGVLALRSLGAGMMSGATSPSRPWFRFTTADFDLNNNFAVKEWMTKAQRAVLGVINKSNTNRALHMMYEEMGAFGTACSVVVDDFNTAIRHHTMTVGEYALAMDENGEVDTMYRQMQKTVGQVVPLFGLDGVSTRVKNAWDTNKMDQKVDIIHAIEPRQYRDTKSKQANQMRFRSTYLEVGSDLKDKVLRDSGFNQFPVLGPRWALTSGDTYGESPAMDAIGDVKQLMSQQLRKGQAIDYMSNPPLQVPAALVNTPVNRLPGGVTFVPMGQTAAKIESLFNVNLDLNHLREDIQDVRMRIDRAFYTDLFMMLSNSDRRQMTATEVAERHEEKLLMLGPVIERIHNELLEPLINRIFIRLLMAGALPPLPQELQGKEIRIEYVSMLAQAQRAVNLNSVDRYIGTVGMLASLNPQVIDKIDVDYIAEEAADMLGVDPQAVVPGKEVMLIRQQRSQAMAQQQQIATLNEASQALKNVTTPDNSPAGGVSALQGY